MYMLDMEHGRSCWHCRTSQKTFIKFSLLLECDGAPSSCSFNLLPKFIMAEAFQTFDGGEKAGEKMCE